MELYSYGSMALSPSIIEITKLYAISMMYTLNARRTIRSRNKSSSGGPPLGGRVQPRHPNVGSLLYTFLRDLSVHRTHLMSRTCSARIGPAAAIPFLIPAMSAISRGRSATISRHIPSVVGHHFYPYIRALRPHLANDQLLDSNQ
ncbi:hypothetical protein C8J57DRAFT_1503964 [Mycena rebaudengoi]|nr:hypothetical protein C8J57DRAFT_1503964 [Mycena rebaudengoi]